MNTRGYSIIEIKSIDDDERIIEGIASTPVTDRMEDVVEPLGGQFALPLPLKWQHGKDGIKHPIGWVTHAKPTARGISIKAKFAKLDSPPSLKEDLDRVWALVTSTLVRGLSIGFRGLDVEPIKGTFGLRYKTWEWLELSAVDVPANQDCNITSVKSYDSVLRAALGTRTGVVRLDSTSTFPGASGVTGKTKMKPIAEQISAFEAQVVANEARLNAIVEKAAEDGRTFNEAEKEEQSTLEGEIKSVTEHVATLKAHEKRIVAKATPVTKEGTSDATKASETRGGHVVNVRSAAPKGTTFARCVMALANAGIGGTAGKREAAELAKQYWPDSPEVETILRAAVAAGTTTGTTWAAPLMPAAQQMQDELLELLRPATIVGRIPGLRRVPFNVSVPAQTGGGTYGWVGESQAKPVSALAFSAVTLLFNKIAGIVVLTKELVKFSNPAAEQIVRNDMVAGIAQYIDAQFVDPTVAVNGAISPASITNGATTAAAGGTTAAFFRSDMSTAFASLLTANENPSDFVILMSATVALNLSLLMNSLGQPEFPNLSMGGGTILGLPVIVSQAVGARIIILKASDILIADDGPVEIDISEQASLVMDSLPQASPQTTELVSLWQRNYVGIRCEKFITWKKARSTSVYYVSSAVYSG